jgi:predicted P-loop ATPase
VLDYLDVLKWDGMPRLDGWMSQFLGAADNDYTRAVSRCALIAAVARIRHPGCKVDNVPILEGVQGIGKSSLAEALFSPWFTDDLADLGSKDAAMQTQGAWLIEISELDAMTRGEVSKIKAFISRKTDRFRPPYGARLIEGPRSCVFWGTTNSDNYLKDETGARRFWPIKCSTLDIAGLREIRDQLWAEADHLYQAGVAWWIVNPNVQRTAKAEQGDRYQGDPWDETVEGRLWHAVAMAGQRVPSVSIDELLEFIGVDIDRQGQPEMNRVARILKSKGWERYQEGSGKKRSWRYRPLQPAEWATVPNDVIVFAQRFIDFGNWVQRADCQPSEW